MATTLSFKQECPSCEALVPIRDPKLLGKKIECPKCKFKFVVKAPPEDEEQDKKEEGITSRPSKKPKTAGNGKVTDKKPGSKTATAKAEAGEAEAETGKGKKKKKKEGSKTLLVGGGLAVVAVLALAVGAWFMFSGPSTTKKQGGRPGGNVNTNTPDKADDKKNAATTPAKVEDKPSVLADPTNLLPSEATAVFSVNIDAVRNSGLNTAAFTTPSAFREATFEKAFGFPLQRVSRVVMATNAQAGWVFSVLRTTQRMDRDAVSKRLKLELVKDAVLGQSYFLVHRQFDSIGNLLFKASQPRDTFAAFFVDDQTLLLADLEALKSYLQGRTNKEPEKPAVVPVAGAKQPDATGDKKDVAAPSGSYQTINPDLKSLLDKVERSDVPPMISMAGDVDLVMAVSRSLTSSLVRRGALQVSPLLAKVTTPLPFGEDFAKLVKEASVNPGSAVERVEKLFHDEGKNVALALNALTQDKLSLTAALECKATQTAESWYQMPIKPYLDFLDAQLGGPAPAQPPPPGTTAPKKDTPLVVIPSGKILTAVLTTPIKPAEYQQLTTDLGRALIDARSAADLANTAPRYHQLGAALKAYVAAKGEFPRGTALAKSVQNNGSDFRPPQNRISWMAALLEFLPDTSYGRPNVDPDKEWYKDQNLVLAKMVVPHYVVWGKDLASRTAYPTLSGEYGASYFIGMSGLGMDAASFRSGDKAVEDRLGIFGYDRVTKLTDIPKERLDKVIAILQVPPEYGCPWMAGGGATVRGVSDDEKGCVQPFVCTKYQGKDGTIAIMADGRVRFIAAGIDPALFRKMCTLKGPEKIENFDELVPLVRDEESFDPIPVPPTTPDVKPADKPMDKPPTDAPPTVKPMTEPPPSSPMPEKQPPAKPLPDKQPVVKPIQPVVKPVLEKQLEPTKVKPKTGK